MKAQKLQKQACRLKRSPENFQKLKKMIDIKNTVQEFNNRLISEPEDVVVQDINLTLSPKMHAQEGQD